MRVVVCGIPLPSASHNHLKTNLPVLHQCKKYSDGKLKCHLCDYATNNGPAHLKRHVRYKHTGERPFACTQCDYRATVKENLKTHITAGNHTLVKKRVRVDSQPVRAVRSRVI